ncbi:MAG: succinylglutamate-semialdehyde dehydrogenase [Planctomycetota bacterium]|nr:MAG: succinylglutamate-semialdehyde dehydrogenase [Planctomycetota bacterium]
MAMQGKQWIGGEWQAGEGAEGESRSPSDGGVVWMGRWASVEQAREAVEAARNAWPAWAETRLDDRMQACRNYAAYLQEHADELAHWIATENGKPLWEARSEVATCVAKVDASIDALLERRWTTTQEMDAFLAVTRYRPLGVMFVLGPYNFPAHIPGGHFIPALLAGNTVVFKPSEQTPAVGQWIAQAWEQVGLPAGVFNLVHGAAEVGAVATDHDGVDGVLFTGSYRVGAELHRRLAGRPEKMLALEMGGNNPLVVHSVSDVAGAAVTVILSAYLTSGQRCTCARRLIVVGQALHDRLVEQLVEKIPRLRVGLSLDDPPVFMGPLIHDRAAAAMEAAQRGLIEAGARPLVELRRDERSPALVHPGLIAVDRSEQIEDCEHFGPLLTVQCVPDLEAAIAAANATQYGLSAGFLGDDVHDFHYFLHRIRAGVVNWNRQTTGASGRLPFGGVGRSGNHRPSGYFACDYCSYPVASLESHQLIDAARKMPGMEW